MNLKEELLKIYVNRMADFQHVHEMSRDTYHGPLLMSPNEKYLKQPNPFLAIGKETFGWKNFNYPLKEEGCTELMNFYEDFNLGINYFSSPFWNVIRKIETILGNEPYSCAWTNISKYDQNGDLPDAEHEKIFSLVDDLLIDEIKIIKPKVCVFFTSHYLDYRIQNLFKDVEFLQVDGFGLNQLCRLRHERLPELTFRTYHPRYLRQSGLENKFYEIIESFNRK